MWHASFRDYSRIMFYLKEPNLVKYYLFPIDQLFHFQHFMGSCFILESEGFSTAYETGVLSVRRLLLSNLKGSFCVFNMKLSLLCIIVSLHGYWYMVTP